MKLITDCSPLLEDYKNFSTCFEQSLEQSIRVVMQSIDCFEQDGRVIPKDYASFVIQVFPHDQRVRKHPLVQIMEGYGYSMCFWEKVLEFAMDTNFEF